MRGPFAFGETGWPGEHPISTVLRLPSLTEFYHFGCSQPGVCPSLPVNCLNLSVLELRQADLSLESWDTLMRACSNLRTFVCESARREQCYHAISYPFIHAALQHVAHSLVNLWLDHEGLYYGYNAEPFPSFSSFTKLKDLKIDVIALWGREALGRVDEDPTSEVFEIARCLPASIETLYLSQGFRYYRVEANLIKGYLEQAAKHEAVIYQIC